MDGRRCRVMLFELLIILFSPPISPPAPMIADVYGSSVASSCVLLWYVHTSPMRVQ